MRDAEAQAAELLVQVLGAEHAGGPVGAAAGPLDHRVQVDGRARDLAGEVTSRVCSWPVRRPSRTTRLRSTPSLSAAVVGAGSPRRAPTRGPRCGRRCWPRRRAGSRRRRRPRPSCRGGGSRARARRSRGAERVLELVAVAPLLRPPARSARARSPRAGRCRRSASSTWRGLLGELALVGQPLPGAPGQGSPPWTQRSAIRSGLGRSSSTVCASP